MNRRMRMIVLGLVAVLAMAVAAPAFATESSEEPVEEVTETTEATPDFGGNPPVVVVPPVTVEEEELPWTARYIYPTIAVAAILLVGGLILAYNRGIKRRYEVV